jgi:uncharacterized low-complexity protein
MVHNEVVTNPLLTDLFQRSNDMTDKKTAMTTIGAISALSLSLGAVAGESAGADLFEAQALPTGFMADGSNFGEGSCGEGSCGEGNCGEGNCGEEEEKEEGEEKEEEEKGEEGACGEGACGEGACGEGSCGAA